MVDESLSLRETDPRALRVQGITTAIDSLEQLTETVPGYHERGDLHVHVRPRLLKPLWLEEVECQDRGGTQGPGGSGAAWS